MAAIRRFGVMVDGGDFVFVGFMGFPGEGKDGGRVAEEEEEILEGNMGGCAIEILSAILFCL